MSTMSKNSRCSWLTRMATTILRRPTTRPKVTPSVPIQTAVYWWPTKSMSIDVIPEDGKIIFKGINYMMIGLDYMVGDGSTASS